MPRYIDADALLMDNTWAFYDRFGNRTSAGLAIEEAPTVNAEPVRHGHWIPYEFATNNRWRKCSVCGTADEYINEYGTEAIRRYCPFCGAKMDESNERLDETKEGEEDA